MPRISAVLFDLDETLLDDNRTLELAIARACDDLAATYPHFKLSNLYTTFHRVEVAYWPEVEESVLLGKIEYGAVLLEAWRRTLTEYCCEDEAVAEAGATLFWRHRRETYSMFPDAVQLLEAIPPNLKLAVVTNGGSTSQQDKLHTTGLAKRMQAVSVSGELGVTKPDAAIFETTLQRLHLAPGEAIHVGDSLNGDVLGALNAGLAAAVWLNRYGKTRVAGDPKPHHEIASLAEVPSLLAAMR